MMHVPVGPSVASRGCRNHIKISNANIQLPATDAATKMEKGPYVCRLV